MNCLINIQQMAMRKETALVVTKMLGIVGKKEETASRSGSCRLQCSMFTVFLVITYDLPP